MRRRKRASKAGQTRGQIVDAVSITERPATVEDRAIPGHWEGDLLSGAKHRHIARTSRYVHLVKVAGNETTAVVNGLLRDVQHLPVGLMTSLTWDRGLDMAQHARVTVAADVEVPFYDPQSPWQRSHVTPAPQNQGESGVHEIGASPPALAGGRVPPKIARSHYGQMSGALSGTHPNVHSILDGLTELIRSWR
jgi:hypothetical protein